MYVAIYEDNNVVDLITVEEWLDMLVADLADKEYEPVICTKL